MKTQKKLYEPYKSDSVSFIGLCMFAALIIGFISLILWLVGAK